MEKQNYLVIEASLKGNEGTIEQSPKIYSFDSEDGEEGFPEVFCFKETEEIQYYDDLEDFICFMANSASDNFENEFDHLDVVAVNMETDILLWGISIDFNDNDELSCDIKDYTQGDRVYKFGEGDQADYE